MEKRLQKLEAAKGTGGEPLTIERWIVTPGSMEAELHSTVIAGRPETLRLYEPGERAHVRAKHSK